MQSIRMKDLMIPLAEYVTVSAEDTIHECFTALEEDREKKGNSGHAHRDAMVLDGQGKLVGKVTMLDILLAMEPTYKRIKNIKTPHATLSTDYVASIYEDFDLWTEPLKTVCARLAELKVKDVMHEPGPAELVDEDDPIDKALHRFVMCIHQPLLIQKNGKITGIIRLGDVFEVIRKATMSCAL